MTPGTGTCQAPLSFTISRSLLKPLSVESMMPSNHLILCCPLLLLPLIFPSIRIFSVELALCIRLAKVLKLQLQHQSFQRIFMIESFDYLLITYNGKESDFPITYIYIYIYIYIKREREYIYIYISSSDKSLLYIYVPQWKAEQKHSPTQHLKKALLRIAYCSPSTFWSRGQEPSEPSGHSNPKMISANF